MEKHFFQYFQIFSIFISNESLKLTDKILSVFQNLQMLFKKREKSHTAVNEKRKTEKCWTLFYLTDYFMKPLKMAINHFFFNRSFLFTRFFLFCKLGHSTTFAFWFQDDTRNITRGNWEQQIATNSKLQYFKNNLHLHLQLMFC